jgi:drug/metabolite transporter (DMT)-like permease
LKKAPIPVHFLAVAAAIFWGMSFIWSSVLLRYYEPVTIILFRLILSTLFLSVVCFISGTFLRLRRADLKWFLLSSLCNPFLYFLGETYGLKLTSSIHTAVIIATTPVFSPLAGFLAYRERLRWFNFLGILISFAGITIILMTRGFRLAIPVSGILCLAGAVISALFYSVILKKLTVRYPPVQIIAVQNGIGSIFFLPLFLALDLQNGLSLPATTEVITSFLCLSILASSLAFVFYTTAIRTLGISKTNIFSNLIPVFTAIFSFVMLGEELTLRKIAGMAVVVAGVYLSEVSWKGKRR